MANPRTFMDFSIEGVAVGRVVFELFKDRVPKTAENFRALCTGEAGVTGAEGIPKTYKGSPLHRIIAGFMVQGGDYTLRNGKGGESIYGGTFEDEDVKREIDAEGLLVMANKGKNTNGSQWFVSLRPCPHLNGKHVVFGRVVKGYDVIEGLSKVRTTEKDVPEHVITVSHCGELEMRKVVKKRSPSPSPERDSRSRSRSRSVDSRTSRSPSPKRSSRKHRKHRSERDENGKKIKKHKSSSSSKKHKKDKEREPTPPPQPSAEEMAAARAEEERRVEEERRKRQDRERELEEIRRRNERAEDGREGGGVKYKGRGAMKAPQSTGMRGWD